MEITSFVLGMLTIVAVIIISVIVVGLVKISKLNKEKDSLYQLCTAIESDLRREIENTHRHIDEMNSNIYRHIEELSQNIWREFEKSGRDVTMVEKTIMNQIEETRRYVDSRLDKLASKQVLKG